MSRFEEKVFTDKLASLRYNREQSGQFFEATIPGKLEVTDVSIVQEEPQTVYVVAVSRHRAQIALVAYLMGINKWSKKKQDEQYIEALEATQGKQP